MGLRVADKAQLLQELARRAAAALCAGPAALSAMRCRRARNWDRPGWARGSRCRMRGSTRCREPFALFARLARPIDFAAMDEKPVDLVVLLLTPANGGNQHLATLAALSRPLRDRGVRAAAAQGAGCGGGASVAHEWLICRARPVGELDLWCRAIPSHDAWAETMDRAVRQGRGEGGNADLGRCTQNTRMTACR